MTAAVGNPDSAGKAYNLVDCYARWADWAAITADLLGADMPDYANGAKGAEDSLSVLAAWRGGALPNRPMFYNDHKEAEDPAACAIRFNDPVFEGKTFEGQWKLFLDAGLLRQGTANPVELFDLASDPREETNRIDEDRLKPLVKFLKRQAVSHLTACGHRLVSGSLLPACLPAC